MKALSTRLVFSLAALSSGTLGLSTLGCSSDKPSGDTPGTGGEGGGGGDAPCTANNLSISFSPMYSAYIDGSSHMFQIPAVANGVSGAGVKWAASDPTAAQIERGDTSGGVLITMLKAGTVTITASLNGMCGSAPLTITEATEEQWKLGNDRYNNTNPLPVVMTDANGIPTINPATFVIDPPEAPPACTNCHGETAMSTYFKTVSHTPQQTGGFSDTELAGIITMAALPAGGYFADNIIPKQLWGFFHKWNDITGDTAQGMVVYLRSLPPKTQGGKADFGMGFMRPAGGGATGAGGAPTMGTGGTTGTGGAASGGTTSNTGGGSSTGGKASGGASSGGAAGAAGAASGGGGGTAGAAGAAAGGSSGSGGASGAGGK